ncbi:unnamed protein product [Sphagnum tenellum]
MRNVVEFLNEALGTMLVPDIYRSACEELHLVVKRVENLQQRCKTLPWLDAAITLANVKEEVLELLLDLSWWTHMLKIATNNSGMGGSGVTQKVEAAVMKLEALFEKLRKEGSSFQKASQADKEYLVSRLQGVLEEKRTPNGERSTPVTHDREYILATYLLFRIEEDPIAPDVEPQLKHYVWVNHLGRGANGEWLFQCWDSHVLLSNCSKYGSNIIRPLIEQIRLQFNFPEHSQLDMVFKAACICVQLEPTHRPKMTDVVAKLTQPQFLSLASFPSPLNWEAVQFACAFASN